MRKMKTLTATALFSVLGVTSVAQTTATKPVRVPLFVAEGNGPSDIHVTKESLKVKDQKHNPVIVDKVLSSELPLRVGIVIDTSRSQTESRVYEAAVQELVPFMQHALTGSADRVFLETFDSTVSPPSDFMDIHAFEAMNSKLHVGGATALYDAIFRACKKMEQDGTPARRVLFVISDGEDNQSHHTRDEAVDAALKTSTAIITLYTMETDSRGEAELKRISSRTGGFSLSYVKPKNVPALFMTLAQFLANLYEVDLAVAADTPGRRHGFDMKLDNQGKAKLWRPIEYLEP